MEDVISFDKSLQQRLLDYDDIFPEETLSLCEIDKRWNYHLQVTMDVNGWQAIWKISRSDCQSLNIPFPTIVLVLVLDVDFKSLKAIVRIMAVQDDMSIPEKHVVPLIQLWPTMEQDKSVALNIYKTAYELDSLRFFYLYLYMPWDRDHYNDEWKSKNLENRLRLHFDLKNGSIPKCVSVYIESLLSEARRLNAKREMLETNKKVLEESDDEIDLDKINHLKEIHVRLHEIRSEIEIYEDPNLRDVLIKRHMELNNANSTLKTQRTWAITGEETAEELINFFERVKARYPSDKIIVHSSLTASLETGSVRDKFLLNGPQHIIFDTVHLEDGTAIIGMDKDKKPMLTSNVENVMMKVEGDVLIENLIIDSKLSHCAILVSKGKGTLKNCKIIGSTNNSTQQGVIVLEKAELEMINCEIQGFYTSIVSNSGSSVIMEHCEIASPVFGMKVFDNCDVTLKNVSINNSHNCGILVETEKDRGHEAGDYDVLKTVPGFTVENTFGKDNSLGNVVVYRKSKLVPVEDLFSNPNLDPTIIESDDDNMECDQKIRHGFK